MPPPLPSATARREKSLDEHTIDPTRTYWRNNTESPTAGGTLNNDTTTVEVARQCSNLAPALQLAVSSHRAIRRRRRPAPVSPTSARALPRPVPRLTAAMLGEAERRYKDGEILRGQSLHRLHPTDARL